MIASASFASAYVFSPESKWTRADVEGSLFVVKRSQSPVYRLIILNQRNPKNLVEDVTTEWEISKAPSYVFFRVADGNAGPTTTHRMVALWISDEKQRLDVFVSLEAALAKLQGVLGASSSPDTLRRQRKALQGSSSQPQRSSAVAAPPPVNAWAAVVKKKKKQPSGSSKRNNSKKGAAAPPRNSSATRVRANSPGAAIRDLLGVRRPSPGRSFLEVLRNEPPNRNMEKEGSSSAVSSSSPSESSESSEEEDSSGTPPEVPPTRQPLPTRRPTDDTMSTASRGPSRHSQFVENYRRSLLARQEKQRLERVRLEAEGGLFNRFRMGQGGYPFGAGAIGSGALGHPGMVSAGALGHPGTAIGSGALGHPGAAIGSGALGHPGMGNAANVGHPAMGNTANVTHPVIGQPPITNTAIGQPPIVMSPNTTANPTLSPTPTPINNQTFNPSMATRDFYSWAYAPTVPANGILPSNTDAFNIALSRALCRPEVLQAVRQALQGQGYLPHRLPSGRNPR